MGLYEIEYGAHLVMSLEESIPAKMKAATYPVLWGEGISATAPLPLQGLGLAA